MQVPDKLTYKTTITNVLRDQIRSVADIVGSFHACNVDEWNKRPCYLEIGCDVGWTMISLADNFPRLVGVDIDEKRIKAAKENIIEVTPGLLEIPEKFEFIVGTRVDIPEDEYDVVLFDAAHDYENVKADFQAVLEKNKLPRFLAYFHDYGLVGAGVKRFVDETFKKHEDGMVGFDLANVVHMRGMKDGWNPLGGAINDWEAAYVIVQR